MYDSIIFTDVTEKHYVSVALGAFKVASILRQNGYSCLVINHISAFSKDELKTILDSAVTDRTKLIGFSTSFMRGTTKVGDSIRYYALGTTVFPQGKQFEDEILSHIRTKNRNIKFVVGGASVSEQFSNKNIDYAVIGYSECSMLNLMDHLTNGTKLTHSIKNIRGVNIIDDRNATLYDFQNDIMIWDQTDIINHKVLPIEIGRGCIFKCKFCSYPMNGKKSLDFVKSPENLYRELLTNYEKYGIRHYTIVDDTFNDHTEKLKLIEDVVKRLPFQPLFWCYTRLDLLCTRPETVEILYNIGVRSMYFGIETLYEKTGRIIGKGYNKKKQVAMIKHIREKYPDISMHGSFIVGLPEESYESVHTTYNEIISGEIPLHSWIFKVLIIFKPNVFPFDSDITKNYSKYGYEKLREDSMIVHWKNEHFTYDVANKLSDTYIKNSRSLDNFKLPGHDAFELVNYGYDFQTSFNTAFKLFKFGQVENVDNPKFIADYKNGLLSLLQK